jgi:hypothetical protein
MVRAAKPWALLLGLVTGPWGARAWAQGTPQDVAEAARREAAAAFEQGTRAFEAQDFSGAAEFFETADRLVPSAPAGVYAVRAHRGQRDPFHDARAATLALSLLSRYPDDARVTSYAYRVIDELSPGLGRLTVRCQGCELSVDARAASGSLFVEPGRHTVTAAWGARVLHRDVDLQAGQSVPLELEPPPEAPTGTTAVTGNTGSQGTVGPTVVPPPGGGRQGGAVDEGSSGGMSPAVFGLGLVVTAGLGGTLLWSGLDTLAGRDEYVQDPTQARLDDGRSRELRTNGLLVGTALAGAATILVGLFFTRWRAERPAVPAVGWRVAPTVVGGAGAASHPGLTLQGSF